MTGKHDGATWRAINGAVVSDKPTGHDSEDDVRHYGGHLVAESIRDRETAAIIAAALDMRDALEFVMDNGLLQGAYVIQDKAAEKARSALAKSRGK